MTRDRNEEQMCPETCAVCPSLLCVAPSIVPAPAPFLSTSRRDKVNRYGLLSQIFLLKPGTFKNMQQKNLASFLGYKVSRLQVVKVILKLECYSVSEMLSAIR